MYQISTNEQYVKEHKDKEIKFYAKEEYYGRVVHRQIEENMNNEEWSNVIAERKGNKQVMINSKITHLVSETRQYEYPLFNNEITEKIRNRIAVVASDTLMKEGNMAGYWCITDINQEIKLANDIYHKK